MSSGRPDGSPPLSTTASIPGTSLRNSPANRPSSSVVMNGAGSLSRVVSSRASSSTSMTRRDSRPIRVKAVVTPARARSASIMFPAPPPAKPATSTSSPRPASTRATARLPPPARQVIRLTWLGAPQTISSAS